MANTETAVSRCTCEYVRYVTSNGDRERSVHKVDGKRVSYAVWREVFMAEKAARQS